MCAHMPTPFLHMHMFTLRALLNSRSHLLASIVKTRTATTQQDSLVTGYPAVHIVIQHLMSSDIDLNGHYAELRQVHDSSIVMYTQCPSSLFGMT